MRRFVKVVKAKSAKLLDARVYARVREPSHRVKREEKIRMREKGKSARAVGDIIVRAISKKRGRKKEKRGRFFQKRRRKFRKTPTFSQQSQ